MYKVNVYKWVLLSDPQIGQESRIQVLNNLNWRKWFPANFQKCKFSRYDAIIGYFMVYFVLIH